MKEVRATTDILIRDATPDDWERVVSLLVELGRPPIAAGEGPPHREAFASYLARDDTVALVAQNESDGDVVGFLDMDLRPRLNFLRPQAWIPDLVVAEDARGRGVGSALLSRAEDIARERDCWGMTLESANWRERAHAFYLLNGWEDTGHSFTKSLTGEPWPPPQR